MNKAINAFLARATFDAQDNIAKQCIRAIGTLAAMARNADDRGMLRARETCEQGYMSAIYAFALVNADKRYEFAGDVHKEIPDMTEAMDELHDRDNKARGLLGQAALVIQALHDKLTPVTTVSGLASPVILRGDYAIAAMQGLVISNDNLQH